MAEQQRVERKLACILCADVKDYSALMARDEQATLVRLKADRATLKGEIDKHRGRVINTWGDALIAEFASPVEALRAAVATQRELAARNGAVFEDRRMVHRIGINLGDVMCDGDDLYGDGVNVAARLESLATPGGIAISSTVYDLVRRKLDLHYIDLGDQYAKNIGEPVRAYGVTIQPSGGPAGDSADSGPPLGQQDKTEPQVRRAFAHWRGMSPFGRRATVTVAAFFALNVVTGLESVWFYWPAGALVLVQWLRVRRRSRRDSGERDVR